MPYINKQGYLERKTRAGVGHGSSKGSVREWWLVKFVGDVAQIHLDKVNFPLDMAGKRIRLKVEVLE